MIWIVLWILIKLHAPWWIYVAWTIVMIFGSLKKFFNFYE